eukprot:2556122-Rhodomonas_salina.1
MQLHGELPISVPAFFCTVGPTRLGEQALVQDPEKKEHVYQSKLFFFEKFIDQQFRSQVVHETNHYVADMANQPRPDWTLHNSAWLLKWTAKWQPLDEATFMCWLAFLMVLSLHKTAGEREVFSRHWLYVLPCIQHFFNSEEHECIKAALHCQQAEEEAGVEAIDGKPQLHKICFLLDHISTKCTWLYHPGPDITYNEISILMAGSSESALKKQLWFKPIGAVSYTHLRAHETEADL